MDNLVISLFLLTHVITDFWIQDDTLTGNKRKGNRYQVIHALHFFLITLLLMMYFFGFKLLPHIFILSILHFAIDKLKISLEMQSVKTTSPLLRIFDRIFQRSCMYKSILLFMLDQLLHIASILLMSFHIPDLQFTALHRTIADYLTGQFSFLGALNSDMGAYAVLVLTGYIFIINGGTVITKKVLALPDELGVMKVSVNPELKPAHAEQAAAYDTYDSETSVRDNGRRDGEVIGILERIIVLTLVIIGQYQAIAFVVAAKSIARFKEFDKKSDGKNFADYYLEGTLASIGVAIITGILLGTARKLLL